MQRDMDLVKTILSEIRSGHYGDDLFEVLGSREKEEILYHLKIMTDYGLVDAELVEVASRDSGQRREYVLGVMGGLTWEGHEFLDAAQSPSAWQRVKEFAASHGGRLPYEVIKSLLIEFLKHEAELSS